MGLGDIIGRKHEIDRLQQCVDENKAQLVIVYGRRRVGKTYLVDQVFKGKFAFKLYTRYFELLFNKALIGAG